jgi:hypothetical protein
MRTCSRNSPEAAGRIVALVLISDGHVCRSEIDTLNHLHIERELGLAPDGFAQVIHTLCEDLLMGAYTSGSLMASVDPSMLASLLAEVETPALQHKVLQLAKAAAEADRHLAEAELVVLDAARRHWRIADESAAPVAPQPAPHAA